MTETSTDQAAREITITRRIDAPREAVFQAFTDADHIAQWWGPEGFGVSRAASDPTPGGAFTIVMVGPDGTEYPVEGVYREVNPPGRLVTEDVAFGPDGTKVIEGVTTLTLEERDGKTELTLHARAVALVPEAIPMIGGMEAGWSQSLRCLDDMLAGTLERQIVMMRLLEAPRERVFEAFTTQSQVERWWGPDGFTVTTDEMDVRPGGIWRFTMHGPDGTDYLNEMTYEVVAPPELLVYTVSSPGADDPPSRGMVALDEMAGMTVLTMKAVFASVEARDLVVEKYDAIEGGNQTLGRLEAYLAGVKVAGR